MSAVLDDLDDLAARARATTSIRMPYSQDTSVNLGSWRPLIDGPSYDVYIELAKDNTGEPLRSNFTKVAETLAYRTDRDFRNAVLNGEYKNGERVLPPREFLDGIERRNETVCARINSRWFKKIKDAIENKSGGVGWVPSSTESSADPSKIECVRPLNGHQVIRDKNDHMDATILTMYLVKSQFNL